MADEPRTHKTPPAPKVDEHIHQAPPHHDRPVKAEALKDPAARNILVIIAVMAFFVLMAFVFARFNAPPATNRVVYNQFLFTLNDGIWETVVQVGKQPYLLSLRFNPNQVQNVTVTGSLNETFHDAPMYLTFDPEPQDRNFKYVALATGELGLSMVRALGKPFEQGCLSPAPFCDNITLVTCADSDKAVILLNDSGPARVELKGNCVILGGEGFELLRAVDRTLYQWYQIMR